ncbi:conserved hypothetical protein [Verticillium alfalfae VaMs.102]|uniref:Uncharacterized protein n=1 Tax=Verticillium alfalfae (strain VaMs.102 / ATCC MYA-4576 / FGSC 10136) TaxID=526221 RepID=C9SB36_VERA1|nr:conserved hypothetical protein [Verticillium alfalfae VaMs.102]EEY15586.1 conserved hypothetical protein [Verticillium alfalfae VaMs.102]
MSPNTSPRRQAGASSPSQSRIPRLQGQASQGRDAGAAGLISRPTPIPQWPLPGPIPSPVTSSGSAPYKPPPGRSQPPQRPPRPSQVPSILDSSRVQDHTPVFQYNARDSTQSQDLSGSVPPTPSSRQTQSTISSVGSIPDFPMPDSTSQTPGLAPPRRSVGLGPPPSSRRGDSSFYSNASFVSPIPEESPRSRSHGSYASSAAIPESWGTESPEPSPAYQDRFFEDPITEEESFRSQDDDGDESKLVRSASIGKRGKPAIVMNRGVGGESSMPAEPSPAALRPAPTPVQGPGYPFQTGTGFLDVSSSSSESLSCIAQNSLVTFDGRSTRTGGANSEVVIDNDNGIDNSGGTDQPAAFEQIPFLTITPPYRVTTVVTGTVTVTTTITAFPQNPPSTITPAPVTPTAPTTTSSIPSPTATFMVTEEVLDFARAVVLFVLQERDLQVATASQTSLQRFFSQASSGSQNTRDGVTQQMAASLGLADGITVDLVHFLVDISSSGTSGGSKRRWVAEEAIGQLGRAHVPTTTASRG